MFRIVPDLPEEDKTLKHMLNRFKPIKGKSMKIRSNQTLLKRRFMSIPRKLLGKKEGLESGLTSTIELKISGINSNKSFKDKSGMFQISKPNS